MNIFLDSNRIIDAIKYKTALNPKYNYFINPIVYSEVLYGFLYLKKSTKILEMYLRKNEIRMVKIDKNTSYIFTKLKLELNKKGIPLEDNDLFIAASCIEHSCVLDTANIKHFDRILDLEIAK